MPESTTGSPWLLPYPNSTGLVKAGATDFQELAERCTTIFGEKFLLVKTSATEITAKAGELVEMTAVGTVNLPKAAAANTIVGVFAQNGEVTVKTTSAEQIVGDGLTESSSIKLSLNQHVIVQYDGIRYLVIGGTPKESIGNAAIAKGLALVETENVYSAPASRSAGTEYEPSGTRCTVVILMLQEGGSAIITVGGVTISSASGGDTGTMYYTFICPPKVKWKVENTGTGFVKSTYLSL